MPEKRPKKSTKKETKFQLNSDYLCAQRLSAAVLGGKQNFSKVGPCEFVPFDRKDDVTLESIKQACIAKLALDSFAMYLLEREGPYCQISNIFQI